MSKREESKGMKNERKNEEKTYLHRNHNQKNIPVEARGRKEIRKKGNNQLKGRNLAGKSKLVCYEESAEKKWRF